MPCQRLTYDVETFLPKIKLGFARWYSVGNLLLIMILQLFTVPILDLMSWMQDHI